MLLRRIVDRVTPLIRTPLEGYEQPELVEMIYRKTVTAPEQPASWPEMAGASSVLDFGGGCGIHYRRAAAQSAAIRWAVVETPAMAARAAELQSERLRFFSQIENAGAWLGRIDVVHSNGALQYVEDPRATLAALCDLRAPTMIWERMALSRDSDGRREIHTSHLVDSGPGAAPLGILNRHVRLPRTILPESDFVAAHREYRMIKRGDDHFVFQL
ncbi:MAG: hypothetical protein ABFD89_18485 [Bryobacteraceae bacterium]